MPLYDELFIQFIGLIVGGLTFKWRATIAPEWLTSYSYTVFPRLLHITSAQSIVVTGNLNEFKMNAKLPVTMYPDLTLQQIISAMNYPQADYPLNGMSKVVISILETLKPRLLPITNPESTIQKLSQELEIK
ncbi:MAG: hypothetical protein GXO43_04925 [Crenarchaeota archaeon]|nr:hypothetical protein [Thermoproteota archaeon]